MPKPSTASKTKIISPHKEYNCAYRLLAIVFGQSDPSLFLHISAVRQRLCQRQISAVCKTEKCSESLSKPPKNDNYYSVPRTKGSIKHFSESTSPRVSQCAT